MRPSVFLPSLPSADELARRLGRGLLVPPAVGYALWRRLDRLLHTRGLRCTCRPGPPTVAVGGMSPDSRGRVLLTSWLLGWAAARGLRAAVTVPPGEAPAPEAPLHVAPDADPQETGIEAALLARYCSQCHILVSADPIQAARTAVTACDPDLLVLQDAVTDYRVARDMNLVLLTPEDLGPGWNRPVPAGVWRGDATTLDRATAFCVFAGADRLEAALQAASRRLKAFARPIFGMTFGIWRFRGPSGAAAAEDLAGEPYIAVLGESDRDVLPDMLRRLLGLPPRMVFYIHDRHRFTLQDFEHLRADALRLRTAHVLTSPRLEMKLRAGGEALSGLSVWTYDPEVQFGPNLASGEAFLPWWEITFGAAPGQRPVLP